MERIGVDILGPFTIVELGNQYVLMTMDYFTYRPEVYTVPDQSAATTVEKLVEEKFIHLSVPAELHSDQGCNFESKAFGQVCQRLGLEKTRKHCSTLKATAWASASTAPWLPNWPS